MGNCVNTEPSVVTITFSNFIFNFLTLSVCKLLKVTLIYKICKHRRPLNIFLNSMKLLKTLGSSSSPSLFFIYFAAWPIGRSPSPERTLKTPQTPRVLQHSVQKVKEALISINVHLFIFFFLITIWHQILKNILIINNCKFINVLNNNNFANPHAQSLIWSCDLCCKQAKL